MKFIGAGNYLAEHNNSAYHMGIDVLKEIAPSNLHSRITLMYIDSKEEIEKKNNTGFNLPNTHYKV